MASDPFRHFVANGTHNTLNNSERLLPTLCLLCLRSLESSLGKGLVTLSLQGLPFGLAEKIYKFVFASGSRMAQMEVSRALAPLLSEHVTGLDFSAGGIGCLGDSALLELAAGCSSGLQRLDISACCLVTNVAVLEVLTRCPSLVSLAVSGCDRVTDEVAYLIPHRVPCLTALNLAGLDGITAGGVSYLSYLPSLEHLCLGNCWQVDDVALTALGVGHCRNSLRRLDLAGTAITDGSYAPSLRNMKLLEYVSVSSTRVSIVVVAALARDLRLSVALPDAPKTRARTSRALLMGSNWSRRQLAFARSRTPAHPVRENAEMFRYGQGAIRRSWAGGRSKRLRVRGGEGADERVANVGEVKVGFDGEEGRAAGSGRELLIEVVRGIVRLWPAFPLR